jgi:lipopolysaccharide/colanic/teichoic acid biosynthesis glycosyltransferase
MTKRLVDVILASIGLILGAPLFAVAAVGILRSSPGPILYRATRIGLDGHPFTMYKFRTMHVRGGSISSAVTVCDDPRVFRFGSFLRKTKIDELPQFINILCGDMSLVGPRPEDPELIRHYTPEQNKTLTVRPGLASPGSIYNYTHGERLLDPEDPHGSYARKLLPIKLALDLAYIQHASVYYDTRLMFRAIWVIACSVLGRRKFPDPPELAILHATSSASL